MGAVCMGEISGPYAFASDFGENAALDISLVHTVMGTGLYELHE